MMPDNNIGTSEAAQTQNSFAMRNRKTEWNSKDSAEECDEPPTLKRSTSFKKVCQFPVSFCRRNSRDFLTWMNGFTITKRSPLSILEGYYKQIRPASLLHVLVSLAVFILFLEACLCLSLLINMFFETGFMFLFTTFIGVCSINTIIMTKLQRLRSKKRKEKSKEI